MRARIHSARAWVAKALLVAVIGLEGASGAFVGGASPEGLASPSTPSSTGPVSTAQEEGSTAGSWGSDHVGQPLPEYMTGDECLFCHRVDVGPTWSENPHQRTLRAADPASPSLVALGEAQSTAALKDGVTVLLGGRKAVRFLKPNGSYGQLSLLSTSWIPSADPAAGPGTLHNLDNARWDDQKFGDRCAGCHTTAVDAETRAFSSPSLDCYTCHGVVSPEHTKDTSLVVFSHKREHPPREVISTCAQCHIRTGRSRSTGLPYPHHFVAGDNLFLDFEVDLGEGTLARLGPADRHVLENINDVLLKGDESVTCLSCHTVHEASSDKHRTLRGRPSCATCHPQPDSLDVVLAYEATSELCEY